MYHDTHVLNVRIRRLRCDEIWPYPGTKARVENLFPRLAEVETDGVLAELGVKNSPLNTGFRKRNPRMTSVLPLLRFSLL